MYMKKIPCWERSSKILILNLSYNEDGIDKLLEVFMCANLLWVKCFRLLSYDWHFGKYPSTIPKCSNNFPKTYCKVVDSDGRFLDDFLAFLKLFKRQQFASLSSLNDFQLVVGIGRGSAAAVLCWVW